MRQMEKMIDMKRNAEETRRKAEEEYKYGHIPSYRKSKHQERVREREEEKRRVILFIFYHLFSMAAIMYLILIDE